MNYLLSIELSRELPSDILPDIDLGERCSTSSKVLTKHNFSMMIDSEQIADLIKFIKSLEYKDAK